MCARYTAGAPQVFAEWQERPTHPDPAVKGSAPKVRERTPGMCADRCEWAPLVGTCPPSRLRQGEAGGGEVESRWEINEKGREGTLPECQLGAKHGPFNPSSNLEMGGVQVLQISQGMTCPRSWLANGRAGIQTLPWLSSSLCGTSGQIGSVFLECGWRTSPSTPHL